MHPQVPPAPTPHLKNASRGLAPCPGLIQPGAPLVPALVAGCSPSDQPGKGPRFPLTHLVYGSAQLGPVRGRLEQATVETVQVLQPVALQARCSCIHQGSLKANNVPLPREWREPS